MGQLVFEHVEPSAAKWIVARFDGVNVPKAIDNTYPVILPPTVLKSYHDSVVVVLTAERNEAQKAAEYLANKLKAIIDILNN